MAAMADAEQHYGPSYDVFTASFGRRFGYLPKHLYLEMNPKD